MQGLGFKTQHISAFEFSSKFSFSSELETGEVYLSINQ